MRKTSLVALLLFFVPVQEDTKALLDEGRSLFERGEYRKAEKFYDEILAELPAQAGLLLGRARVRLETGRYEEALADLEKAADSGEKNPEIAFWRGEIHRLLGRYEQALPFWETLHQEPWQLPALERRGFVLEETGKREEALAVWKEVAQIAAKRIIEAPRELLALGTAYERLKRFPQASEVYAESCDKNPYFVEGYRALGDLYARVQGDSADVGQEFSPAIQYRDALKKNPNAVEVLLSRYELYRANFFRKQDDTTDYLRQALAVNPFSVRGRRLEAEALLFDRRFPEAKEAAEKALAVNPRDREAAALRATIHFVMVEGEGFGKIEKRLLVEDPQYGRLYAVLGGHLKDLYRFEEAVPWLRKAIEIDPERNEARTDLGQCLANTNREKEALSLLEEAEKAEPGFIDPWRRNMIVVLRELEEIYRKIDDPPFRHALHPDDAEVLVVYLAPLYQEALLTLSSKYGFTPKPPITIDTFRHAADFSARTIGFTGFGALGVCFGNLITAVSPSSEELRRRFNFIETAWHEFAHVITVGLSRSRIPRWLTEGLSTYEEKLRHPSYDRGMELELLDAYANDRIFPILELNSAFRGPRIIFGYYQGGLLCEMLARDFDFSSLVKMVRLYGEDKLGEEKILQSCFGLEAKELDRRFLEFVREKLQEVRLEPNYEDAKLNAFRDRLRKNPKDIEASKRLAWAALRRSQWVDAEARIRKIQELAPEDAEAELLAGELALARGRKDLAMERLGKAFSRGAEDFFARMHYAMLLEESKEYPQAMEQYRLAKKAFPKMKNPKHSPHLALSRLLQGEGKGQEAMDEIREFAALDSSNFEHRLELAAWHEQRKEWELAARYLEEANAVDPFHRDLHRRWAAALRELGRHEISAREWSVARKIAPEREFPPRKHDAEEERRAQADLWAEEARSWQLAGKPDAARKAVEEALLLLPDHEQALLLRESIR